MSRSNDRDIARDYSPDLHTHQHTDTLRTHQQRKGRIIALMTGTSRTGETFEVVVDTGDYAPVSGARLPSLPSVRVLSITGLDRHGFKSAHRDVARRLGWTDKGATIRQVNKHGIFVVTTFWRAPSDGATTDLPTID